MSVKKININGLALINTSCHACIAGDFVYVSGTLGTLPNSITLIEGGTKNETAQALRNVEIILKACGCTLNNLVKVNVFLNDMSPENLKLMNDVYAEIMGNYPPARTTVGRAELVLGGAVEIDAIAF